VAKKILKINTKTKRAHNLRGAAATATGHCRAIRYAPSDNCPGGGNKATGLDSPQTYKTQGHGKRKRELFNKS